MIDFIHSDHLPTILANNERFVHWLAPLDIAGLKKLLSAANYARQIDRGEGVLIGFRADSSYQSENLSWLRQKFDDFAYIDRVIIGENAQGRGLGRQLYEDFEDYAREHNISRMVCEVNTIPDNPGSHKFHLRLGFKPCGEMEMQPGTKSVRYYEKLL
ncbi:MAG: GNAT family N-acetyltransferase [Acidimicrobiales bacterium]|nr:GNAT family N-acetyltransferase [Hyphomonadaceae bacterium]RZV42027.1 MAG: GNAT family N-acetyltransferase [Acidimicrobiales bacterium]